MVRPEMEKWGLTLADLRVLSVEPTHARSRERFLALDVIAGKQTSACAWASTIGRAKETVLQMGTCLQSVGAGGRVLSSYGWTSPFFSPQQVKQLVRVICETEPVEHGLPGHGWTLKKLRRWLKQAMNCEIARSTLHRILQAARLRWKSARRCSRKPTHRNVPPLWNASKNCMSNSVAWRSVWNISMKPTSTAIWTWATPVPKRTRLPGV